MAALAASSLAVGCGLGADGSLRDDENLSDAQAVCTIDTARELMITDLKVVEDPVRTTWVQDPAVNPSAAAWTFGRLMQQMAGTQDPSDFTLSLFSKWRTNQVVNQFVVPARTAINTRVLNGWPKLANGKLNLKAAPLRLLAIVNRMDLRKLSQGNAGEGRFVFGVLDTSTTPPSTIPNFTLILEYKLPASTTADVTAWASQWHNLGTLTMGSAAYNTALQQITDRFAGANANPTRPNGSSISQIRSDEIALGSTWELREFRISATSHLLVEVAPAQTPANSFNNTSTFSSWVNQNQTALLANKAVVPLLFNAAPFRAGAVSNRIDFWSGPGIVNNDARHAASLNTCDGCHGRETNTGFLQIVPRNVGQVAGLSGFLTGETVNDPVVPTQVRTFNDLAARAQGLAAIACAPAGTPVVVDVSSERAD